MLKLYKENDWISPLATGGSGSGGIGDPDISYSGFGTDENP